MIQARALYISATEVAKTDAKQLKTPTILLHVVAITKNARGVFFETHFV